MLIFFSVDKSDSKLIKQCVTNDFCLLGDQEQDCLTGNNSVHPPHAGANIIRFIWFMMENVIQVPWSLREGNWTWSGS